jgi:hypothetical protein
LIGSPTCLIEKFASVLLVSGGNSQSNTLS